MHPARPSVPCVRWTNQAWIEDERLYIQTELCETSLEKQLEKGMNMEISSVYAFLRQTLLGLSILHQHDMVHLDIKVREQPVLYRATELSFAGGSRECHPLLKNIRIQNHLMSGYFTGLPYLGYHDFSKIFWFKLYKLKCIVANITLVNAAEQSTRYCCASARVDLPTILDIDDRLMCSKCFPKIQDLVKYFMCPPI